MIIDPDDFIPITEINSSKVIDFQCVSGLTFITKYELLNKDINYNNGIISVSDKKPDIINDIQSLKNVLKKVISMAESLLEHHPVIQFMPEQFKNFDDLETDLLINQLVFDVLAKKYQDECEPITCHAYAENHIIEYMDHNDGISVDAIDRCIRRSMSDYYERMNRSDLQEQLVRLGTNLEEFNKYYTPELKDNSEPKKPEFVWDLLFFNRGLNVTYRQFRRQLTKKNRNYSLNTSFEDLKSYNSFVEKLLPSENESPQKYFIRSMRYYLLESYKRIDYIFKLISAMPKMGIDKIDREHFLVKRFVPQVLVLAEKEGTVLFSILPQYYRPLFMVEDNIQKRIQDDPSPDYSAYEQLLNRYQFVRAKTYELFNYLFKFESTDYRDIKNFLFESYNMQSYHYSNEICNSFLKSEWKVIEREDKKQLRTLMNNFMSINNDAFFWSLPSITPSEE